MVQALPTLREYCIILAQSVTAVILNREVPLGDPEIEKLINDLQQEFINNYTQIGMPYGEQEQDLVRYLLDNITIEAEE